MPKPGERKLQILQTLASMLERPQAERVTTASLAAQLQVSEAALYRHFASKAQMFEGLIEFIEQTIFGLINRISTDEADGLKQLEAIIALLLGFAQKNPGMTRVLIGEALVTEDERLKVRVGQLHDRLETSLKQSLRIAATQLSIEATTDITAAANLMLCFVLGRWHQYVKSGFKRLPTEFWAAQYAMIASALDPSLALNRGAA